jgi:diguanylate cyclase (GGDEF)-like protein/PAS domain S-box-containing protein
VIVGLLWVEVGAVMLVGLASGVGIAHALVETAAAATFAGMASGPGGRAFRSGVAALGLLIATGVLVHLSGGLIELHFLFFVLVGLVTLYQDWRPFLLTITFVLLHHGIVGALDPHEVYNHPAAWENPWGWAAIHAAFIFAMSLVSIVAWKFNEDSRAATQVSEERFRGVFQHAAVGEGLVAPDGHFVAANPALCQMLGYSESELCALDVHTLTHPEDRERTEHLLQKLLAGELSSYDVEKRYVRRDGEIVHTVLSVSAIRDADGDVVYTAGVMQDITERKRAELALEHQALHDGLTGLPNRTLALDRITSALGRARRANLHVAVLFLDIDRFKSVNDSLGHAAGDEILLTTARRLQDTLRSGDTVARFGGDEFVVVCEGIEATHEATTCADRVQHALSKPVTIGGRDFSVTVSIGVAIAGPAADHTAEGLLGEADAAMYRAKDRGRDRYELFDTTMRGRALERFETENELRRAIAQSEIVVHYQPVVSVVTGEVVAVEALARWEHSERGLLPPAEFIPIAEETGLVVPLGVAVLEQACADFARWNEEHPAAPLGIAVNVSARQLNADNLPDAVGAALERSGLHPSHLSLEITETALLDDLAANASHLHALKQLGVELAVDDFGTGYSSLLYLKQFPLDVLKIDRSFTSGIGRQDDDTAIVGAVIGLARTLGLRTVAEGVERPDQLVALESLQCDMGQGYLWAKPAPLAEFSAWMAERDATLAYAV